MKPNSKKMNINTLFTFGRIALVALCVMLSFSVKTAVFAAPNAQGCDPNKMVAGVSECSLQQIEKVSKEKINLISGKEAPLTVAGQSHNLNLKKTLEDAIDALIMLIGTVALILIVFAGFRLIAASGNDTEITRAKDILKQTVIGFAIALLAYVIIGVWQGFLFR